MKETQALNITCTANQNSLPCLGFVLGPHHLLSSPNTYMSAQLIAPDILDLVSVPSPSSINIPKAERVQYAVRLDDGDVFEFDEEMHVFKLPRDYGYMSLQLGHRFTEIDRVAPVHRKGFTDTDEYEVVRKLGWGAEGSVWLVRRHTKEGFVLLPSLTSRLINRVYPGFLVPALQLSKS